MSQLVPTVAVWSAVFFACGGGGSDPASTRQAEMERVLEAHLEHEDAMLDILERGAADPAAAEVALEAYVAEHRQTIAKLVDQRRVLETDPPALARAMGALEPEMKRMFERRRALAERSPELVARERVRAALGALDAL